MDNLTLAEINFGWLSPSQLSSYTWEFGWVLFLIPLVPFLFVLRWLLFYKFRQRLDIALPEGAVEFSKVSLLRYLPPVFLGLAFVFFLVALARPQTTDEHVDRWTEGIDIMLALDISHSMKIEDFRPNRMEAAKEVANEFIEGRFQDRIGIVIFSGEAVSYAPLTTDYSLLKNLINDIDFSMIEKSGTAIGSALAVATNRMRESTAKSKVIILLSDGENTAGSLNPTTAAELAYAYGIKIYSIGVGKEGRVPYGKDMFGQTRYVESSLDESTLREMAQIGQGEFFRATSKNSLERVFARIDEYEKSEIKERKYVNTKDYYQYYLITGIVFFLLWLLTKGSFLTNALED
ncbi:vWA domain-containing protein [Sediminitomix flava]|uniref:Ca-activated chloride channel family protein n=1 Tax=Sediminitomix flava TaxID=379075 RepID=A0A315ZHT2_SEDFL|nr:VWA domain-containing protein [Sediminitomix flava]PWJ44660.1 Ca-activated chloride channel family protein [Sediminitomix flava]